MNHYGKLTDKKHISSLDKESFERLFKDYFKALTAFSVRFVNDVDDAKSIVHDVFMKLWEKRDEIDLRKSVKSYLFTAVNNRSLNFIRDHKRFVREELIIDQHHDEHWESQDNFSTEDIQEKINKTLEKLSPKVREAFYLSRTEGLKYKEIAERMAISVKTVETHMSVALKELRKSLKEYLSIILLLILSGYPVFYV